jgi:hypothetical protein
MARFRVNKDTDLYFDPARRWGFGHEVEEKVADILIAGVVVHELEKVEDVVLTGSLRFEIFRIRVSKPWVSPA